MRIISSTQHPLIKGLCKLRTSARARRSQQRVVVAGARALREAAAGTAGPVVPTFQTLLLPQSEHTRAPDPSIGSTLSRAAALGDAGLGGCEAALEGADLAWAEPRVLKGALPPRLEPAGWQGVLAAKSEGTPTTWRLPGDRGSGIRGECRCWRM
jgi:hypothetical protein